MMRVDGNSTGESLLKPNYHLWGTYIPLGNAHIRTLTNIFSFYSYEHWDNSQRIERINILNIIFATNSFIGIIQSLQEKCE